MEQFVPVPASVYNNRSIKTQLATKKVLPRYQVEQNPTYQYDSLTKEINKKLFVKADSSVDKILSCSSIKILNLQTLLLNAVDTGVLKSFFAQNFCGKNADVPDNYFHFTWRCWYISDCGSEWKCPSQREREVGPFKKKNKRSCKNRTRRVVLVIGLCAT